MMKDGYYWVKYRGTWEIFQLTDGSFETMGNDCPLSVESSNIDEIGDYIETPDKYKE